MIFVMFGDWWRWFKMIIMNLFMCLVMSKNFFVNWFVVEGIWLKV